MSPADPLDDALVKEYVGAAHKDLDRVRTMLTEQPLLLNASWDWGKGDFETALGAAGHVGRRDIAEFLLDKGARADLFVLTMLGETAIVKSTLERFPQLLHSYGPHGFTLLHHAQRGGEAAQNLLDFLNGKGLTETFNDVFQKK
ncbi:MAG: ankyrin repeat domain-containing protein [Saprospiraceae bacterium]|nr:ankyrin repeat domain-containing protein [Saprospiraceae bacterium]